MFRGTSFINLDAKGRLAIPSKYRELLADHCNGEMVVTVQPFDGSLWLYARPEYEVLEDKLAGLSSFNPDNRLLQRMLVGNAADVQLDGSGRILLPQHLREKAALEKNTVLVGLTNKFEIWDESRWQAKEAEASAVDNESLLSDLDLPL